MRRRGISHHVLDVQLLDWQQQPGLMGKIGVVAGATERLRLVTSVLVLPYRNPVLTAKVAVSLDVLSAGRLTLGVGAGWLKEEFEALDTRSRLEVLG